MIVKAFTTDDQHRGEVLEIVVRELDWAQLGLMKCLSRRSTLNFQEPFNTLDTASLNEEILPGYEKSDFEI